MDFYVLRDVKSLQLSASNVAATSSTSCTDTVTLDYDVSTFSYAVYTTVFATKGGVGTPSISVSGTDATITSSLYNTGASNQSLYAWLRIWIYEVM